MFTESHLGDLTFNSHRILQQCLIDIDVTVNYVSL